MANLEAIEEMLGHLKTLGRLEDVDVARVEALRSMAEELDRKPSNAMLWKTYCQAVERLISTERNSDDSLHRAWVDLNARMGDTSPA